MLRKIFLLSLFFNLQTTKLLAGKVARELVLSGNCRKILESSPLNINSVNNPTYDGKALYCYKDPDSGFLTPIVKDQGNYHRLLKQGVKKESFIAMRELRLKEARKRLACLSIVIGGILSLVILGYSEIIIQGFSQQPVFWGISFSGSLALDPKIFRADIKYKQARLIDQFLEENPNNQFSPCPNFENFILEFTKALGLAEAQAEPLAKEN